MNFVTTCYAFMVARGLKFLHHMEHLAVAAYSSAEVLGFHWMLWYVSLSLIILGIAGLIYEYLHTELGV